MSRSDAEHLEFLKLARDCVADAIVAKKDVTKVVLGSKTAEYECRSSVLKMLEQQIAQYQKKVSRAAGKAARNRIRLRKGQAW